MTTYRVRQSKPAAVIGAVIGVIVIVAGIIGSTKSGHTNSLWIFIVVGIAVIGLGLWSAFSKHGSLQTIESDDGPPAPRGTGLGTTVEKDESSR
jgi:hypothetical protein